MYRSVFSLTLLIICFRAPAAVADGPDWMDLTCTTHFISTVYSAYCQAFQDGYIPKIVCAITPELPADFKAGPPCDPMSPEDQFYLSLAEANCRNGVGYGTGYKTYDEFSIDEIIWNNQTDPKIKPRYPDEASCTAAVQAWLDASISKQSGFCPSVPADVTFSAIECEWRAPAPGGAGDSPTTPILTGISPSPTSTSTQVTGTSPSPSPTQTIQTTGSPTLGF